MILETEHGTLREPRNRIFLLKPIAGPACYVNCIDWHVVMRADKAPVWDATFCDTFEKVIGNLTLSVAQKKAGIVHGPF